MSADLQTALALAMAPRLDWRAVQTLLPGCPASRARRIVIDAGTQGGGLVRDRRRAWCTRGDFLIWSARAGQREIPPAPSFNAGVVFLASQVLEAAAAAGYIVAPAQCGSLEARLGALEKRFAEAHPPAA